MEQIMWSRHRLALNCGGAGEAIGAKAMCCDKIVADCLVPTIGGVIWWDKVHHSPSSKTPTSAPSVPNKIMPLLPFVAPVLLAAAGIEGGSPHLLGSWFLPEKKSQLLHG